MKHLITAAALLCATHAVAQFSDSIHHYASAASTGVINKTESNSSYVFSNSIKYSMRKKSITLNNANNWVSGQQGHKLTNNDLSSTLDFNLYKSFPHFYYWGLAAFDKSYSLKIANRLQTGLGMAYNFVDKETAFVNVSDGILYETGALQLADTTKSKYNTVRNSLRLRHRFVFGKIVSLDGGYFWQPSLKTGSDYIIKTNTTLSVKLRKWLSLSTAATYNRLNRTQRESLLITFGITAEQYFK